MDIRGALSKLDPNNDEQWTADGLPRIDALEALGLKGVTRGQVTAVAPTFTRFNTGMEEEGEDLPDGLDAPVVEEPRASSFQMESSDFAGAAPLEPPPAPPPHVDTDEAKAALAAAEAELQVAKAAERKAKDAAERAQKARDLVVAQVDRTRTPHEAQMILMNYLASCQPKAKEGDAPTKVEPSPLDKAHARPQGYGKTRPVYPSKQ
jgi:hypothetical protein